MHHSFSTGVVPMRKALKVALSVWRLQFNLWATVSGIDIDVRTTGADTNGGGYANQTLTSSQISTPACTGGTDFSQSDTAHVTFNGSTVTATTVGAGATITITGYTVITGDKCNVLQIT